MKKSSGFTLIEIIISIALIAMLAVGIASINTLSIKLGAKGRKKDIAYNIARSICELYKSDGTLYSLAASDINVYKYINSMDDITSIEHLILNSDGVYSEEDREQIINEGGNEGYTVIIKIRKVSLNPEMEAIFTKVIENGGEETDGVVLNASK